MGILLRTPHALIRRHLSSVERVIEAAGLAAGLYLLITSLPSYPSPWEVVIATAVFVVMLWSPPAAYFLAVTAALYPLYTLSLYLAVLFLAVALLAQRVIIHNMGAALLVLLAPWLAQFHLEWLVVLLGGLWWGKTGGAWIGGLAALWGQTLFGMTGQYPNWLDMMGVAPQPAGLFAQFKDANSLETLKLIVTPLAPNPTLLLYHLLQIVLWAMVGGITGGVAERTWTQQKHPWRAAAVGFFAAAALALGNLALASWLEQYKASDFSWIVPGLLESALYASLAAAGLEVLRDFAEHPFPFGRQREPRTVQSPAFYQRLVGLLRARRQSFAQTADPLADPSQPAIQRSSEMPKGENGAYPPMPVPEDLPRRKPKKQPPDDIIKIELD